MIPSLLPPHQAPLASEALTTLRGHAVDVDQVDQTAVGSPGLYAIYGSPEIWIELGLGSPPDDRPLYVGKAEGTLASRDIACHFGRTIRGAQSPTGSSTLRRSLSALLAPKHDYRGTPRNPSNPGYFANFGLSSADDAKLTGWMGKSLRLAVWPHDEVADLDAIETLVLRELQPPMNLNKVPTPWRRQVKAGRKLLADQARTWRPSD